MNKSIWTGHHRFLNSGLALCILICSASVIADRPTQTIADPGFRPPSPYADQFINSVGNMRIAVLPTLIRRDDRTAYSFASQQRIVEFLNGSTIATAFAKPRRIDLGPLRRPSQWEIFAYGLESAAAKLEGYDTGADFALVMEIVVPHEREVFGIEIYLLDQLHHNAFSFLLNSHHQMFADARLYSDSSREASRQKMILKATDVGLAALKLQIEQARDCVAATAGRQSVIAEPGILHDFEEAPSARMSRHEIPLGFSTFNDGSSEVRISRSDSHPPLPGENEGNAVMQIDFDVTGWAGFVSLFGDKQSLSCDSRDWSTLDGFNFWLYGNNTRAMMFVDILDNRSPCSTRDDAERFTYEFLDDVAGWRLISVPFVDMYRKEIGNGAPNDGLNLTEVHGWGLGIVKTNGPKTFYVDDFRLWRKPTDSREEGIGRIIHPLFIETPIDENTSRLVLEPEKQSGLAVEKAMSLFCAVAELTADRSYRYFRVDQQTRLSGGRASLRVTFYQQLPEGMSVVDSMLVVDPSATPDLRSAGINALEFLEACRMMSEKTN
jgi:hypothetical protein